MEFISNATSARIPQGINFEPLPYQSSMAYLLPGLMAIGLFAFLSYTPQVPKGVPAFTSEKYPFIGSYRFFTHKW
jgi:hypothetical protein